ATGTPEDDVVSEAIEALYRALRRYEPGGTTVSDYVRQRVEGSFVDATRKVTRRKKREVLLADVEEAHRQPIEDDDEALSRATGVEGQVLGSADAVLLQREAQAALDLEVERMPRGDRRLYVQRYREELTWDEISARMGIPSSTLRYHDKRIRDRLTAAMR